MPGSPSPSPTPAVDHPHDELGSYEAQCSVGQKRDESAGPCTPECDRRPAGGIDEAGVDGVKHRAAPARVNEGQGAASRPFNGTDPTQTLVSDPMAHEVVIDVMES